MDLPTLDQADGRPLAEQLVHHFRAAIEGGRLRPGARLPTIRAAARATGVTRTTVQTAYTRLQELGLVTATVGRGTVVRDDARAARGSVLSSGARAAFDHLRRLPQPAPASGPLVCNLAELKPDTSLFPVDAFTASLSRVLADRGPELLGYGQPTGDRDLRALLAARNTDREDADADDVLITNGAQQGIDLVLRTFTRAGDGVAVAVPTYHHLFGLLAALDLRVVPLRGDRDGLDLDELERALARPDVRLLYVMPTFHNPTGRTLDLALRRALMEVVQRTDVPVLEDEFELDLRFAGEPLPSLRSMDARGLTATVRTFSKGLFPGVRLGWIHAAREVLGPMASLKRYMDLETSPLLQAALFDFLQTGGVEQHLDALRAAVRDRHAAARAALRAHMPEGFTWTEPEGGFAFWVQGPAGLDGELLARRCADRGVLVAAGRLFHPHDLPVPGLRISVSQTEPGAVARGIGILAECAVESTDSDSPSHRPLIL